MIKTCLILFMFYLLSIAVDGKTKCVKAVGKVQCRAEKAREADVEIYLMDKDSLNPDDTMGFTMSEEDGSFKVEGCGYDLWSNPDPYLRIWSYCGTYSGRRIDTPIRQIFVPDSNDYGTIPLDWVTE